MNKCIRHVYQYNRIAKKRKEEELESLRQATFRPSECDQSDFPEGTWATWPADTAQHSSLGCTFIAGMKSPY